MGFFADLRLQKKYGVETKLLQMSTNHEVRNREKKITLCFSQAH